MVASILAATQFFGMNHNPELVVNGDFSNGLTGWALARPPAGTLSVVAGRGRTTSTSTATIGIVQALPPLVIGQQYSIALNIFKGTSVGNMFVRVSVVSTLSTNIFQQIFTADGSVNSTFTATATQMYVGVINVPTASGQYFEIDNVSIRRVV